MQNIIPKSSVFNEQLLIRQLKESSRLIQSKSDLDPLLQLVGDSRIVMLGESTHGTHEYYTWRSYISRRLIEEKGFNIIAVEGDWPDCYKINRYIKGYASDNEITLNVLKQFNRWPTWMWANWEMVALVDWLKTFNHLKSDPAKKVGFYGLDVYSLWESMEYLINYLKDIDPSTLDLAEHVFRCFEPYSSEEGFSYAKASVNNPALCESSVNHLLAAIKENLVNYNSDPENVLSAEQNAKVIQGAEQYYKSMIQSGPHSWNIRDRHMADTLERLLQFYGDHSKIIVWEHNTHIGDARATEMLNEGMVNLGELVRVKHADKGVVLIGFGSYEGSVIAGKKWLSPMQNMNVPKAIPGSWEDILHKVGEENKLLIMKDLVDNSQLMDSLIPHRAIGVVYHPEIDQYANYMPSVIPIRYDAFIYLNRTKALYPLNISADYDETPETYPFGF